MTKRKFDAIVKKMVKHGNIYHKLNTELSDWCIEKYGCTWSDLDCDGIIDSFDFGCGGLNTLSFDEFKKQIESKI